MRLITFALLALLLPALAVAAERRDAVAVIIANQTYRHPDLAKVGSAPGDAEAFRHFVLEVQGYPENRVIRMKDATLAELQQLFGKDADHEAKISRLVRPRRTDVLVFFAGHAVASHAVASHGLTAPGEGRAYLLPTDADPGQAAQSGYPLELLYANLARLSARSVTIYLAAAFAGRLPSVPFALSVVTAPPSGPGGFTRQLLNGLYGAADFEPHGDGDGTVRLNELERYLAAAPGQALVVGDPEAQLSAYRRPRPAATVVTAKSAAAAAPAPAPAGTTFRDCALCPEMVRLPAGRFVMGSARNEKDRHDNEGPAHAVSVKAFAIGRYEVMRREYSAFVAATGYSSQGGCVVLVGEEWKRDPGKSWRDPHFRQDDRHPVTCVSWTDAQAYAKWLSRISGRRYRLPTEAEWEYAARGGSTSPYWRGRRLTTKQANFWRHHRATVRVGSYAANPFGLFDVHGNVFEWTEDCRHSTYVGAPFDSSAWTSQGRCRSRMKRGGSWNNPLSAMRIAWRVSQGTDHHSNTEGIRVAREL